METNHLQHQEPGVKRALQTSLEHLEHQVQEDPFKAISSGISFGAGLTALDGNDLRSWAIWMAKLVMSEMMNDVQLSRVEN